MMRSKKTVLWIIVVLQIVPVVDPQLLKQLWPLDSQTCESEVETEAYQYNPACGREFSVQPYDFPYRSMMLDGTTYIDVRVDFSTIKIEHFSVQGLFYLTETNGVFFHYKSDDGQHEVELWDSINGEIRLRRTVGATVIVFKQPFSLVLHSWYYVSMEVDAADGVKVYLNGTLIINGTATIRTSIEIPGSLRIGEQFVLTKRKFKGLVACVAFILGSNGFFENDLCQTCPWINPRTHSNYTYFNSVNDTSLFPEPIRTEPRCSMLQCAFSCLQDLDCHYIFYNETNGGCDTCHMYRRVEQRINATQTWKLYILRLLELLVVFSIRIKIEISLSL